jgi:hypothetical protein
MIYHNYILILIAFCFYIIFQDGNVYDYIILRCQLFVIQLRTKLIYWRLTIRMKYDNYIIQKKLNSIKRKRKTK